MAGAGAGTGAGGDLPTGEMSIEKQLFAAIEPGRDLEEFTRLLAAYTGDWSRLTLREDPLLMKACRNNRPDIVKHLLALKTGAEEKRALANQFTALEGIASSFFIAVHGGRMKIAIALLAADADATNQTDSDFIGITQLFLAAQNANSG